MAAHINRANAVASPLVQMAETAVDSVETSPKGRPAVENIFGLLVTAKCLGCVGACAISAAPTQGPAAAVQVIPGVHLLPHHRLPQQ